ncbi:MAG: sugar transferase [Deltaproteobacteria bacterium]|nr:sugar transferase [Deltaproteobacteria bacterium]
MSSSLSAYRRDLQFDSFASPRGVKSAPRARVIPSRRSTPVQRGVKRAIDLTVASLALLVFGPLMLVVAALVRLTSRGPAFFRQVRVGHNGKTFEMLKFRSMIEDAERLRPALEVHNERTGGPVFKMRQDPRVTPLGRFIRQYSIDELPQLLNVLRGEMSLVGPRPPLPDEVERYEDWQLGRLSVMPGLTCTWQVSHNRYDLSFEEWVRLDLAYIDGWTVGRDLALLFKTVPAVLSGKSQC